MTGAKEESVTVGGVRYVRCEPPGKPLKTPLRIPARGSLEYKARAKRWEEHFRRMRRQQRVDLDNLLHAHLTPGQNVLRLLARAQRAMPRPVFVHCFGCRIPSRPDSRRMMWAPVKFTEKDTLRVCTRTQAMRNARAAS